ncbi:putative integral membrane protein [Aspergillus steynii IBT 23096]|uniref:Putative integral membrane protein n=1 Tax=Aspergillus steynii IBT 23096 TaxID=1392250 RepID=A0A2I2G3C2_9EURO|nr:putative integral membrane protein [Aspergillus steynii IBT 23096]PLB47371.1 putative integral membrane protein [Aspergillus steynii IBT 23096]
MASGLIFDPLALLRVIPLASSTGTLVCATGELTHNSAWTQPDMRKKGDSLLPRWYSYVFPRTVSLVLVLNLTSIGSAAANLLTSGPRPRPWPLSRITFYWAGLFSAISHLVFVPWVAPRIQRIVEDLEGEREPTQEMEAWLGYHRIRMLLADAPAWLAFVGAVLVQ